MGRGRSPVAAALGTTLSVTSLLMNVSGHHINTIVIDLVVLVGLLFDDLLIVADGGNFAHVLFGIGTEWLHSAPTSGRSTLEAPVAFQEFAGLEQKIETFCCDNANG